MRLFFPLLAVIAICPRISLAADFKPIIDTKNATAGIINKSTTFDSEEIQKAPKLNTALSAGGSWCQYGTILYPGTPLEINIYWRGLRNQFDCKKPEKGDLHKSGTVDYVMISRADSAWSTDQNIRIGSKLEDIEKIFDGSVSFGGFGWEYGGSCCLENEKYPKMLGLTFSAKLPEEDGELKKYYTDNLEGDKNILSDSIPEEVRKELEITVKEIVLSF